MVPTLCICHSLASRGSWPQTKSRHQGIKNPSDPKFARLLPRRYGWNVCTRVRVQVGAVKKSGKSAGLGGRMMAGGTDGVWYRRPNRSRYLVTANRT